VPGYLAHWRVLRDAAMIAAGTPEKPRDPDVAAVVRRAPLVSFPNGPAPAKDKDRKTAYYGGVDALSAYAYIGACAPSFLFFGAIAGKGARVTREAICAALDAAADPDRDAARDRLSGDGLRLAPGLLNDGTTRTWLGGVRPHDLVRDRASDLLHANRSGTAILNLLALARAYLSGGEDAEGLKVLAFALGHIAHYACDLVWHPAQATLAGPLRDPSFEHVRADGRLTSALATGRRYLDLHLDAWTAVAYFGRAPACRRWSLPLVEARRHEAAAPAGRGIEALFGEVACEAWALAYPGEERAFSTEETAESFRFFREVMLERVYRRAEAVLPPVPLLPLVAPGFKKREGGAIASAVSTHATRVKELADGARELVAARAEPRAHDEASRKKQAEDEKTILKEVVSKEKELEDDLVGEGADSAYELFSLAARLAARLMTAAVRFVRHGDGLAYEALQNWSLDSGYRVEPDYDEEAAKGSFPRLHLRYRHVKKDLDERRLFDLEGLGDAPPAEGRSLRVDVRYHADRAAAGDDRFILREGDGARFYQVLDLAGDARPDPAEPERLVLEFTDVQPGRTYSLECDPGAAAGRYFVFRERKLEAKDLS